MNNFTKLKYHIKRHDKKEGFLIGTFMAFLSLLAIGSISNYFAGNIDLVYFESFFMICLFLSFLYYIYSKNLSFGIHSLIIFATLVTYALLIEDNYRLSLFHVIVPLNYFFLFTLRRALFYTLLHELIVISIYTYGYFHHNGLPGVLYHGNILSVVMASMVIIFFGIVYHLSIENSYKKLEKSDYQKEILLNETHHRVKNNLSFISSMLGLQQKREKDMRVAQLLGKNRLRIQSIAIVHETLYRYESFQDISFYEYTKKLTDTILNLYSGNIEIEIKKNDIFLSTENILKFGIITNELLTNSLKHAFKDNMGKVFISLTKTKNSYIYSYKDNGKNSLDKKEFMSDDKLGLKIIKMMVEQMEAKLTIQTNNGLGFEIVMNHRI